MPLEALQKAVYYCIYSSVDTCDKRD